MNIRQTKNQLSASMVKGIFFKKNVSGEGTGGVSPDVPVAVYFLTVF